METPESSPEFTLHKLVADKGQSPLRIDKFIVDRLEGVTRTKVQKGIDENRVLVNDKPVKANYKIRPGDEVRIVVAEEPQEYTIIPEDIPLNIVYEDDQLLVINKPAGIAVHPGVGNYTGTISNALAHYFGDGEHEMSRHPYLVHRIDMNTSGLLLIGKNEEATRFLANQFRDHSTKRTYHALVWGVPEEEEGTIEGNIGRNPRDRQVYKVVGDDEGKHAITHYRVLENFSYTSLVECKLETGRTHQIRVHMKYLGHPLFSDEKYGGQRIRKGVVFSKYKRFVENCFEIMPRHALHAKTLGFVHPVTREEMLFDSELPDDFATVLTRWRNINESYSFSE